MDEKETAVVVVHKQLIETLQTSRQGNKGPLVGFLSGLTVDSVQYITGLYAIFNTDDHKAIVKDFTTATNLLPGGVHITGLLLNLAQDNTTSALKSQLKSLLCVSESNLSECFLMEDILVMTLDESAHIAGYYLNLGCLDLSPVKVKQTDDSGLEKSVQQYRVRGVLSLGFDHHDSKGERSQSIRAGMCNVCKVIDSPASVFLLDETARLLYNRPSEEWPQSSSSPADCLPDSLSVCLVHSLTDNRKEGDTKRRQTKQNSATSSFSQNMYIDVHLLLCTTGQCAVNNSLSCAPVIHHTRSSFTYVEMCVELDVLACAPGSVPLHALPAIFVEALSRQLDSMSQCLIDFSQGETYHIPRAYHFKTEAHGHTVTLTLPEGLSEEKLEPRRASVHKHLLIPLSRPVFRRVNALKFINSVNSSYLINVHLGLPSSNVLGGRAHCVRGDYVYRHYMQDRVDDNGWGCAYRSLQTIVSWLRLQGYTDKQDPTHSDIQQALVDIGDKEPSFVGSRKWIGSTEVSFVLDQLYGISCKLVHVSSGKEMASVARELARHFDTQQSPVMIGGGVLAHTILGVDWNEQTGEIKFLILDPHYTGSEDLRVIQDKGWCGWKSLEFWDQNAYYNLCMPQLPTDLY